MNEIARGQLWRHKKRGSTYYIVEIDARIQLTIGDDEVAGVLEGALWVAYRDVRGGDESPLCFRMKDEFLDGRFERV